MRALLLVVLAACGGAAIDPCRAKIDQQWGTAADDEALGLVASRSGPLYVTGYRAGTLGVSNLGPVGDAKGYVRKLSVDGAVEWETALDTSATDIVEAVVEDGAGRVHVAGRTTGAFTGATQAGQFDAFVATLAADGRISAVRQFGDERPQHPRRLALAGPRLLLAGFDDVFVPTNYVEDWENWFVAEHAADGLTQTFWRPVRTAFPDLASALAVDPEGAVYVAGSSSGGDQPGIWVRKLDVRGDEIWGVRLSSVGIDTAAGVAFGADGSVLIGGTRFGNSSPVVYSLDRASGAKRWAAEAPRELTATAVTDMAVDASGNVYLTGSTATAVSPAWTNRGVYDPYVLRFAPAGALTATWQGGSAADDEPTAIALDSCGRVLIAGWTDGALAQTRQGRRDAFLVSVDLRPE